MTGGDDRDGVSTVGRTDRAHRLGPADLPGNVAVAAGLSERNGQQRLPHLALEFGPHKIQLKLEAASATGKVLAQLPLGFLQHRCVGGFPHRPQADPLGSVVLPQNGRQPGAPGHQRQLTNRGVHQGVGTEHGPAPWVAGIDEAVIKLQVQALTIPLSWLGKCSLYVQGHRHELCFLRLNFRHFRNGHPPSDRPTVGERWLLAIFLSF